MENKHEIHIIYCSAQPLVPDEWIIEDSNRLAPFRSKTTQIPSQTACPFPESIPKSLIEFQGLQ